MSLLTCPGCARHLRASEATCPFCGADVRATFAAALPRRIPTERLGRTALMAFAAANIGVSACGGQVDAPGPDMPLYGAPPGGGVNMGGQAGATGGSANTGGTSNNGTGGRPGSGGRTSVTGGAPNTGGTIIAPPYGIPPIPPGTGGDMGIPIYGNSPPKP